MFPNPQDALPLLRRPNPEGYKNLAKDLVSVCRSDDEDAIAVWSEKWMTARAKEVTAFVQRTLKENDGRCRLADAQLMIARVHGFKSWARFSKHLNDLLQKDSSVARYESAADAIVKGDIKKLKRLVRDDPRLVHARSTREHRATLLHYVSANGVEGYRQKTPANIVEIAELLLNAGAEVDAEADVYGGGMTTLGLVASSEHPLRARVQNRLMQLLLDHGADIEHKATGGDGQTPLHWAVIFGQLEMVKLLLKYNPPLESVNMYGGTVLGQTTWSAAHGGDPKVYAEIIETLIAAGAVVPPRHVPVNKPIDDLLRRYGSEPEPTWYWYGEKPVSAKKA